MISFKKAAATVFAILFFQYLFSQKLEKPLFRFGLVTDVQYADQDQKGTRFYRRSLKKLEEAVEVFNKEKIDFVLSLGDYIDNDLKSYDSVNAITRKLTAPLYHTLGNHDFLVGSGNRDSVFTKMNLKTPYYSFSKNGWRFISINGNDISMYGNNPGSKEYTDAEKKLKQLKEEKAANAFDWNGAVGDEQLKWIRSELNLAKKNNEKVIMMCHFPLYPDGEAEQLWNASELRNIIEAEQNVLAYLNGHVHKSQYFFQNGVNYISFRGMVEKEANAFAIVDVYPGYIKIHGYGEEISRVIGK